MVDKNPLITIILPVYNGEKTLKATLDSLLAQTYTHFKIIIGIDGTKDASKSIAEAYKDSRINIFENPVNLGLADNVNKLMTLVPADSDLIAMAEQDDYYVPERLAWQVEIMQKHPEVGLVSGIVEFKGKSKSILFPGILVKGKPFPQGEALFTYLYINQLKVVNTCMLFRKSVHEQNKLKFRNTYGNFNIDWDYILRFSLVSNIYGIPKKLVVMNRTLTNDSVTRDKDSQHKASRQLLKNFRKEFPEKISKRTYNNALKMHRKIELGHHTKLGIIFRSLYYFLLYFDTYFLMYVLDKTKSYFVKN
ncbi:glycosyltransferase family 2 protein [Lacinutrix gracilariae]|uniref:Glycosyltransferase family 2 protein n=1 Tax=Lacinutrix gracilariae TaxID=1747198 RepID=A0ABW5K1N0_9FLAO